MACTDTSDAFRVEEDGPVADGAAPAAAAAAAGAPGPKPAVDEEVLRLRLAQRQKQVDFGKNTIGYQRYSQAKPKGQRRSKSDPQTPDVHQDISKRCFDGQIKAWRRALHQYDQEGPQSGGGKAVHAAGKGSQQQHRGQGEAGSGSQQPRQRSGAGGGSGRGAKEQPQQPAQEAGRKGSEDDSMDGSRSASQGSLDGYLAPSAQGGKKRGFDHAFVPQQQQEQQQQQAKVVEDENTQSMPLQEEGLGDAEEHSHDAKRTTSAKIKDAITGPTSFPTTSKPAPTAVAAKGAPPPASSDKDNDVVALIMDQGGSNMSWASDEVVL